MRLGYGALVGTYQIKGAPWGARIAAAVLLSAACPLAVTAGGKTPRPAPQQQPAPQPQPQPQQPQAAAQALPVPEARALIVMIRSSLMALHHANLTGNYTVLHDLASEDFQRANTPAKIGQAFASLSEHGLDLSLAALLTPQLLQTPAIDRNGLLQLAGFFPSEPQEIHFKLTYQASPRGWRLFALAVAPVQSSAAKK